MQIEKHFHLDLQPFEIYLSIREIFKVLLNYIMSRIFWILFWQSAIISVGSILSEYNWKKDHHCLIFSAILSKTLLTTEHKQGCDAASALITTILPNKVNYLFLQLFKISSILWTLLLVILNFFTISAEPNTSSLNLGNRRLFKIFIRASNPVWLF